MGDSASGSTSRPQSLSLAQALDKLSLFYKPATKTLEPKGSNNDVQTAEQAFNLESNTCDKTDFKDADSGFFLESPRSTLEKGTALSLPATDASSFSSTCSDDENLRGAGAAGDFTVGDDGDDEFVFQDDFDELSTATHSESARAPEEEKSTKTVKKRGISTLLNGIFSWNTKRVPSSPSLTASASSTSINANGAGTLILESRPAHLPAKSRHEEARHVVLYRQMLDAAKRKEFNETRRKEKEAKEQLRQEEAMSKAAQFWSTQVLNDWEVMRYQRRTQEMFAKGVPPSVRGAVWKRAIGNKLSISSADASEALKRAADQIVNRVWKSAVEDEVDSIVLDISRTFPSLGFFQLDGPYHSTLHVLLTAFATEFPQTGYVQGMSFLGAVLLLQMDQEDAYVALANLLARPLFAALYSMHQPSMEAYFTAFESILDHNLPVLSAHFRSLDLKPVLYLLDWLYTLYSRPLPLDVACRVWDVFLSRVAACPPEDADKNDEYLFAAAVGVLRLHQRKLLEMDFIQSAQFLTRPIPVAAGISSATAPEVDADRLLKLVDGVALFGHQGSGRHFGPLAVKKSFTALVQENLAENLLPS